LNPRFFGSHCLPLDFEEMTLSCAPAHDKNERTAMTAAVILMITAMTCLAGAAVVAITDRSQAATSVKEHPLLVVGAPPVVVLMALIVVITSL
jgi:cytochrome bd-type quinol oxidase subunit 2